MFGKTRIPANHIGLRYRDEKLDKILQAGRHWLWATEDVDLYDMDAPFKPTRPLNYLLQQADLAQWLQVWELADGKIGALYRDGNFVQMLSAGVHAYWKGANNYILKEFDTTALEVDTVAAADLIRSGTLNQYMRIYVIEPWESAVLYINGLQDRILKPGRYYFWNNANDIKVFKADNRTQTLDISGQELLTRDKAQVRINLTGQYRVVDLLKYIDQNRDTERMLYVYLQVMVRNVIGQLTLDELLDNKENIFREPVAELREKAQDMGMVLEDVGIKDVILPGDVKTIMHQVLVAEKRAQANIIMRREETASMRSMLNTAKLMEENTMLLKLKEMEYVEKIAEKIHTISLSGGGQIVDQLKALFVK